MRNNKTPCVCAIIEVGNKYVSVSRKDNPLDFGLPGGKIDEGETPFQAIIREVKEETGLHVTGASLVHEGKYKGRKIYTYRIVGFSNIYDYISLNNNFKKFMELNPHEGVVKLSTKEELCDPKMKYSDYNKKLL